MTQEAARATPFTELASLLPGRKRRAGLARAEGQATSLHLLRSQPQLALPDAERMFGRLGQVHEGKIPPHRGEREFATKGFLLKCEVVAGPLMGILGVSIVMINQLYIVSKRGFSHKGSKLGYGTALLDWTGANQGLKFSNVSY